MFKKAEDMVKEVRQNMRGGNGQGELNFIFNTDELKGKQKFFATITLTPGSSIGTHEHVNEEEIFFFLSGKGVVVDNGERHEVKAGDAVVTGNGSHSVENTGDEPLHFLGVILTY